MAKFIDSIPKLLEDSDQGKKYIRHTDAYYKKKSIRIGKDYQTYSPTIKIDNINREELCLARLEWCPSRMREDEINDYLQKSRFLWSTKDLPKCDSSVGFQNKLEEISLKILHLCNYSAIRAYIMIGSKLSNYFIDGTEISRSEERDGG